MPSNIATTHSTPSTNRWTVTPNWRESDNPHAAATAKGIQDILNRTETLPILSNVLYRHIVTLLALSVTFALWKRHRVAGLRATRIDAVALVGIAVAVYGRFMLVAVGLTAAYAVWSALADRPWNEAGKLPGFGKFVGGLRPAGEGSSSSSSSSSAGVEKAADTRSEATTTTTTTPNAEDSTETPDCIICWSSEVPPLLLPCAHTVCKDCLARVRDSTKYQCPLCSLPLFRMESTKTHLFQLYLASSAAVAALGLLLFGLRCWKGHYWSAGATAVFSVALSGLNVRANGSVTGLEGVLGLRTRTLVLIVLGYLAQLLAARRDFEKVDFVVFFDGQVQRFWGEKGGVKLGEVVCEWVPWGWGC